MGREFGATSTLSSILTYLLTDFNKYVGLSDVREFMPPINKLLFTPVTLNRFLL